MTQHEGLPGSRLRTPKAAAIAGIIFSLLLLAALLLLRISAPADGSSPGIELIRHADTILLALNIIPIAGVAFLWFIGVLRDRLGQREDRLFSTVFFGSGILFLVMLFSAAAVAGATIAAFAAGSRRAINVDALIFARRLTFDLMNVFAIKMAAVFMFSTSTVAVYTQFAPRSIAILGYVLALVLLLGGQSMAWSFFAFPLWVLLLSTYILIDNFRPAALKPGE